MITNNIKKRIKNYFLLNPTSRLRVRQIERATKTALPSIVRYVKELEKEGILRKEDISSVIFYLADRSSKEYILEKKLFNIKNLFTSELINYLIDKYHNAPIVVFGSYSKGEDNENSDIDIYIQSPKKEDIDTTKFEKILQRKIQKFIYKDINEIKNKNLINNIMNGVTLNGFIEVIK
jgi:predicted nucleotidyltransferase